MGIDLKKYLKSFKNGTKNMFIEFFNKNTNKKQRANMWTFTRLIIPVITTLICIISLFVTNTLPFLISATLLTGFGSITDYFDGKSARKHNSTSEYGKLLDQVADKIFSSLTGISLCILNPLFLVNLLGEAIIATINLAYKSKNPNLNIKSSIIGRIKEWPLFITLGFGFISTLNPILNNIATAFIISTFLLQLITAGSYISQNEKSINELKKNEKLHGKNILEITDDNKTEEKYKVKTKSNEIENLKKYKNELLNYNTFNDKVKVYTLRK